VTHPVPPVEVEVEVSEKVLSLLGEKREAHHNM